MNINVLYITTFIISFIILYLIKIDIEKFKKKLYNEIDKKIWYKIYTIIVIGLIHIIWLINIFLFNYNDNSFVYAFPYILLIPYLAYVMIDLKMDFEYNSVVSDKLDKYLNYCISAYFSVIIVLIIIPNSVKKYVINNIKNTIYYLVKKYF